MSDSTITKSKLFKEDIALANGGTGAEETGTRLTSTGAVVTLTKLDASHINLRSILISVEQAVDHFYDARGYGTAGTQAAIILALADIGASNRTLYLAPGTWTITADLTVDANVTLLMPPGAILAIATTKTVTINGPLEAGRYQIFSCTGTGKVVLGTGSVDKVYPQWWGAVSDGPTTDDTAALQSAATAASGRKLYIPKGSSYYKVTKPASGNGCINLDDNTTVEFEPGAHVKMVAVGTDTHSVFANEDWTVTGNTNIHFIGNGGIIDGDNRTAASSDFDSGICLRKVTNCSVRNMHIWDTSGPGINVERAGGRVFLDKIWINGDPLATGTVTGCDGAITIQDDSTLVSGPGDIVLSNIIVKNCMEGLGFNALNDCPHVGRILLSNINIDNITTGDGITFAGYSFFALANAIISNTYAAGVSARFYDSGGGGAANNAQRGVFSNILIYRAANGIVSTSLGSGMAISRSTGTNDGYIVATGINIIDSGYGHPSGYGNGLYLANNLHHFKFSGAIYNSARIGILTDGASGKTLKHIDLDVDVDLSGRSGISMNYVSLFNLRGQSTNNGSSTTTPYGVVIANCDTGVINSLIATDNQGVKTQTHGMAFSGTNTNLNISGNNLVGNGTGAITGTYPTTSIVANNLGVAATPAVPASTVEQRNNELFPVRVTITGGTVTVIAKGPTSGALITTGATSGTFTLQPKEYIAITYSVAPTWNWEQG